MSKDMDVVAWNHGYAGANGIRFHHVRHGTGTPLVLLHGWPEFWYVYRKNIPVLAERFNTIVPDLRGFGDTEKPGLPDPPSTLLEVLVEDLASFMDALGIDEARTTIWRHGAPELPKIDVPTRYLWGEEDPLVKIEWAERLGEYFSGYSFSAAPGAGHFVHCEIPEAANCEIIAFFSER